MTRRRFDIFCVLLALIACVAVVLRWIGLGRESLWFDEGMTWWLASLPPGEMLRVIRGDVAAPIYFWLLHAWQIPFGDSASSMRAMSALAATISLVPFYLIARRVLQSRFALLVACALMAVSFMQVQYAKEARYYALLSLLATTALACVPSLVTRRSFGSAALFIACITIGLYTHNMMIFCLAGLNLAWLCWPGERSLRQRIVDIAIVNVVVLLLYLPWVPTLFQQMKWMTGTFWAKRPDAWALIVTLCSITGVDVYELPARAWNRLGLRWTAEGLAWVTCVALLILMGLLVVTRDRSRRSHAIALMVYTFGPVILVFVYSQFRQPIFMERVFIASSATIPLLLGMAVDRGTRSLTAGRAVGSAWVATLGLLGLVSTTALISHPRKEQWRDAYASVARLAPSNERLIVFVANEGELPFAFYAAHDRSRTAEPRTGAPSGFLEVDPPKTIRRVVSDADLAHVRSAMSSGRWKQIVLILSHEGFADPDDRTERLLRSEWELEAETTVRRVRVLRFRSRAGDGG